MKNLVMIAFVICFGSAVTFAQANLQETQVTTITVQKELVYKDIAKNKVPVIVIEAFGKESNNAVIVKTAVATSADNLKIYRISVKDTQGQPVHYFYNEDGSKFGNDLED